MEMIMMGDVLGFFLITVLRSISIFISSTFTDIFFLPREWCCQSIGFRKELFVFICLQVFTCVRGILLVFVGSRPMSEAAVHTTSITPIGQL